MSRPAQLLITGDNCAHCTVALVSTRRDAKYCSPACRQAAYRERNRRPRHAPGECDECDQARERHTVLPHL